MMTNQARKFRPLASRLLLAMTCAACLAAPMLAQDPSAPPPPPQQQQPPQGGWQGRGGDREGRELEHMTKALNLTPDQVTQIKAIHADGRQQMEALRNDTSTPQADKRAKFQALHQAQETKVKALLNDDQKAKYDAMQSRMRERQEDRPQGPRAQPQGGDQPAPPPPPPAV